MLLRGRNTVGYTPYPTEVTDAFVHEAAATGHGHLPDLRRAQRRRADAARDRRRARHRHGRRRGRALLHRRPVRPGGGPLHARLLPAPGRGDRRRRARTCSRSRTWPGCSGRPRPARWSPRCASASTCRCTCTPTTPRAASSPRSSRRSRPGWTPSTGRWRRWRAPRRSPRSRPWWRPPTTPSAPPGCRCRRSATWSRTGRRCGRSTGRSSPGSRRPPAASTTTRSPAGSCPTCASRPSRWGWATGSS